MPGSNALAATAPAAFTGHSKSGAILPRKDADRNRVGMELGAQLDAALKQFAPPFVDALANHFFQAIA
jgi:hypothetical protein